MSVFEDNPNPPERPSPFDEIDHDVRRCGRRLREWEALWRTLGLGHPQEQAAFERMNRAFAQMLHDAEAVAARREREQEAAR